MMEFGFSETYIRKGNWLTIIVILSGTFLGGTFAWYSSEFRSVKALVSAIGIYLLIQVPLWVIIETLRNRRLRKWKVLVYEDKIVKQCGKKQQILLWNDITGIKTVRSKGGVLVQIRLWPNKPNISMYIAGFTYMDNLFNLIRERIHEDAVLHEKRFRLNWWQRYLVGVLVIGLLILPVIFIIASIDKPIGVWAMLLVGLGLALLVGRPLTEFNLKFKWIESIAGIGMLIVGIYMLICLLKTGRMPL